MSATVGRQPEQALLSQALGAARSGRTQVVLLHGEPGIGKTTLVEAAASLAAGQGMAVAWGRSWEAGGAPPYWPFTQVLRGLRKHAPDVPPEIARLLPELGGSTAAPLSAGDRFVLFDGVVRFLAAVKPALLALEDLHAADPASLQLLEFVAAHLRDAPLLILGTFRDLEARMTPSSSALLERVGRSGRLLAVGPLDRADVAALLARGPSGADDETAAWLHDITKGNPLFLREMLHVLVQGARKGERPPLPESVRAAIREHIAALPPELLQPLEVAAVIGREFGSALLAQVAGAPPLETQERMQAATRLGVLVERGADPFAFSHALIAETLLHDLPASRRAALHAKIAEALEPAAGAEIARHLFEAGPEMAPRAVAAALQAAGQSLRQLAFEQAEALLVRALSLGAADSANRFELLLSLGQARMSAGEETEGRAACREAAALARELGSAELLSRAALAYGFAFTFGQTDPVLVDLLEDSLRQLPPGDSELRARLLGRLAAALQPAADPRGPVELARQAVAMARRLRSERTRLEVFYTASAALSRFAPVAECAAIDQEALDLSLRLDAPVVALRTRARLAFDQWALGHPGAAASHVDAYDELSRAFRRPHFRWLVPMFRAMRAMFEGRFAEQEQHLAEAEPLLARVEGNIGPYCLTGHRVMTARLRGDDGVLPDLLRSFSGFTSGPYSAMAGVMLALASGRRDEAHSGLARILLPAGHSDTGLDSWGAECAYASGNREAAERFYSRLLPHADENAAIYLHGFAVNSPVSRGLFLAAATLGRMDDARRHAERARWLMQEQGGRPHEARILLEMAEVLGGPEAPQWLREAHAIAGELKMPLDARIRAAQERLDRAAVSLVCEGDFWTVAGPGGSVRLKHTRGLSMLARLVAEPGKKLRALDIAGGEDVGDAGEAIDAEARDAYRARLRELDEELEEASGWNDSARAERLREESEALREELSHSVGAGGRARKAASAQERARINVQRRLADALRRIAEANSVLGDHLSACVKTGTWCSYTPP